MHILSKEQLIGLLINVLDIVRSLNKRHTRCRYIYIKLSHHPISFSPPFIIQDAAQKYAYYYHHHAKNYGRKSIITMRHFQNNFVVVIF